MKVLKVFENNPNPKFLDMAVEALRDGDIVIYPTDTLYAIGCDALNNSAINKICKLKGINPDKTNLSIICDGISMAAEYARFDNRQFKVLKTNLPGPFTFILPSSSSLPKVFKGRKTVGIRVPENNVAVELVRRLGNPILSTTISYTDDDYAVNPELIAETYADSAAYLLDGGDGGLIPSTVVDMTSGELEIVREGKGDLIY
jgi:tRNA threonylcarbamoyl adenosine modification protein (Sua5/YciO/YrdC/YwlC family)